MADVKISELDALGGANTATTAPAVDDLFASVDTSGSVTVYMTPLHAMAIGAGLDTLSDHGYHGITLRGRNYGYTAAIGDPVYLNDTAGEWLLADADLSGAWPARGIACNTGTDGSAAVVMVMGVMRHDAWAFTEGQTLYLSDTGTITGTAPTGSGDCIQVVGFSLSDDEAFFNFTGVYAELT